MRGKLRIPITKYIMVVREGKWAWSGMEMEVEVGGDLPAGPRQARKRSSSQVGRWWELPVAFSEVALFGIFLGCLFLE